MSKTKIILASTLSVLAVASVTTAAVVVTQKRKKQSDSPKTGNEGNQVVVADDSKFEYTLNAEQTKELTAKLLLVKGQDVTVTLTENNASKTVKTKVKEDGTIDFSTLKDGKTYTVTKIVVKEGENERDLITEVKAHNEDPVPGTQDQPDADKKDQPADQPVPGTQDQPADQPVPGTQDQPDADKKDQPADQTVPGTQDQPADQPVPGTQDQPDADKKDQPADQPVPGTQDQPDADKKDQPADQPVPGTQDQPADQPVPSTQDQPDADKKDQPADQPDGAKQLTYSK